jgi:hypothetical protein
VRRLAPDALGAQRERRALWTARHSQPAARGSSIGTEIGGRKDVARKPWRARVRMWTTIAAGALAGILFGWFLVEMLILR